jgi:hypothetical protein
MNCAICDQPLLTPLDQYGPSHTPVCGRCWLWPPIYCPDCDDGTFTCHSCAGDGTSYMDRTVECYDCDGAGYNWCQLCDGRVHITIQELTDADRDDVDWLVRFFREGVPGRLATPTAQLALIEEVRL